MRAAAGSLQHLTLAFIGILHGGEAFGQASRAFPGAADVQEEQGDGEAGQQQTQRFACRTACEDCGDPQALRKLAAGVRLIPSDAGCRATQAPRISLANGCAFPSAGFKTTGMILTPPM